MTLDEIQAVWNVYRRRLDEEVSPYLLSEHNFTAEERMCYTYCFRMADYLFWITDPKLIESEFKRLYKGKELTEQFIKEAHEKYAPLMEEFFIKYEGVS